MGQHGDKEGGCRTHAAWEKQRLAPMQALDDRGIQGVVRLAFAPVPGVTRVAEVARPGPFRVLEV